MAGGRRIGFPYWASFLIATTVLAGMTIVLVLVVLPQRFVLQADLKESGISFPSVSQVFDVPAAEPLVEPPPAVQPFAIGPGEALWNELGPLLAARLYGVALERMDEYLLEYPADPGVRRERARVLVALGRGRDAREAYSGLARDPGTRADQLALARFLRDAGDVDGSVRAYRAAIAIQPDDASLSLELARALMWAERAGEAIDELRPLLEADPGNDTVRLELARALWALDRPDEARVVLAGIRFRSPRVWEAVDLDLRIAATQAPYPPAAEVDLAPLARARRAVARQDYASAARWYASAVEADAGNREVWRERIDFLQWRAEDPQATIAALDAYAQVFDLTGEERLRLARLLSWTGQEERASVQVDSLLAADPGAPDAWTLRGDLFRWSGDRVGAGRSYARALELEPEHPDARMGRAQLDRMNSDIVARFEPRGIGPFGRFWGDSDDYRRLDAQVDGAWISGVTGVRGAAGYRWLEGISLSGVHTTDGGPYAEADLTRWWREATVRTTIRGGVQRLDGFGVEPSLGVDLRLPEAGAWDIAASFDHGPAYRYTWTYEAVEAGVRADALMLSAFRAFGSGWTLGGSFDGAVYAQRGSDNGRLGGRVSLGRRLSQLWSAELATSVLGFTDAAPVAARRIYWDPKTFWATTLTVGLEHRPPDRWGVSAFLTGGTAWIVERDVSDGSWVPQLGTQGSLVRSWGSGDLVLSGFYRRGRERDYSSWGAALELRLGAAP